jgi:ribosome-binding factor A
MSSRRLLKAAEAVRQVLGMAILAELRDPRVRDVTVTHVEMTPDMREAKVFVSVMGDTAKQNLCLHGLQSARGFLQSKIAEGIETRYTPRLRFVLDQGVKRSLEIARILREVLPGEQPAAGIPTEASDEATDAVADDFEHEESDTAPPSDTN